jgi:hypothetical protein
MVPAQLAIVGFVSVVERPPKFSTDPVGNRKDSKNTFGSSATAGLPIVIGGIIIRLTMPSEIGNEVIATSSNNIKAATWQVDHRRLNTGGASIAVQASKRWLKIVDIVDATALSRRGDDVKKYHDLIDRIRPAENYGTQYWQAFKYSACPSTPAPR